MRSDSKREARKRQTRTALIKHARKYTSERGLNGFTLDELCEAANISRRTFFNHFASKDDAILGFPKESPFAPHTDTFKASPSTTTLAEALGTLLADSLSEAAGDIDHQALMRIVQREPGLVDRLRQHGDYAVEELSRLICEREGLTYPDPYARTVSFAVHQLTMFALNPNPHATQQKPPPNAEFKKVLLTQFSYLQRFLTDSSPHQTPTNTQTRTTEEHPSAMPRACARSDLTFALPAPHTDDTSAR